MPELAAVTGAFSYTGRYITSILLDHGDTVRTLTRRGMNSSPFGERVEAFPFNFDDHAALGSAFEGANVFYNTYWIRFPRGRTNFDAAVVNTGKLVKAAKAAGVRRIVHISITNPSESSPLPYFRGKALTEKIVTGSGLSYGIVRPTVVFGRGDVFINNIAWLLRRFPFFAIPGDGKYRVRPVFVEDVAHACVELGAENENMITDCAGPEIFTFEEWVTSIGAAIGKTRPMIHVPPGVALQFARLAGTITRDVVLNREELAGLMGELVMSSSTPRGKTSFLTWLEANADQLGRSFASELDRNFRRSDIFEGDG